MFGLVHIYKYTNLHILTELVQMSINNDQTMAALMGS